MNKQDVIRKLSSRKFWAAVIGFVSSILTACKIADSDAAQITAILTAGGSLIAYILSEGWVDANREGGDTYVLRREEDEYD